MTKKTITLFQTLMVFILILNARAIIAGTCEGTYLDTENNMGFLTCENFSRTACQIHRGCSWNMDQNPISVCNKTDYAVKIAVQYVTNFDARETGWWSIDPGHCQQFTHRGGFSFFARDAANFDHVWDGSGDSMCTDKSGHDYNFTHGKTDLDCGAHEFVQAYATINLTGNEERIRVLNITGTGRTMSPPPQPLPLVKLRPLALASSSDGAWATRIAEDIETAKSLAIEACNVTSQNHDCAVGAAIAADKFACIAILRNESYWQWFWSYGGLQAAIDGASAACQNDHQDCKIEYTVCNDYGN